MLITDKLSTNVTFMLASDTTSGLNLILGRFPVIVPFIPGGDMSSLVPGDLPATTILNGMTVPAASRTSARDAVNGDFIVSVPPPAGGWQEVTGAGCTSPTVVYGTVLCTRAGGAFTIPDNIVASELFPNPITVSNPGELVDYGECKTGFSIGAWH